jgi:hypothetical protein
VLRCGNSINLKKPLGAASHRLAPVWGFLSRGVYFLRCYRKYGCVTIRVQGMDAGRSVFLHTDA